jgi:hypothetical protein
MVDAAHPPRTWPSLASTSWAWRCASGGGTKRSLGCSVLSAGGRALVRLLVRSEYGPTHVRIGLCSVPDLSSRTSVSKPAAFKLMSTDDATTGDPHAVVGLSARPSDRHQRAHRGGIAVFLSQPLSPAISVLTFGRTAYSREDSQTRLRLPERGDTRTEQ